MIREEQTNLELPTNIVRFSFLFLSFFIDKGCYLGSHTPDGLQIDYFNATSRLGTGVKQS